MQHAHNPVNWIGWGSEAFELAKKEDKMIFLSIGYSTCHWCHVMEHESFENEAIAKIMNESYICVKVDREERPDVDRVYMTFVQAITGSGGWPLSVWLTPSLKPIYGGTYFPPTSAYGRPGFPQILQHFAKLWKDEKEDLVKEADRIMDVLKKSETVSSTVDLKGKGQEVLNHGIKMFLDMYDADLGGFGDAPKFPRPSIFNFMFRMYSRMKMSTSNENLAHNILNSCLYTLTKMAKGGMYDHCGGGFHRYSVDAEWHVPHFEKMMYDQGQLIVSYCEAFQITKDPFYSRIATETIDYCLNEMRFEGKAFWSAEDADSLPESESKKKLEGAFYVWTPKEVSDLLQDEELSKLFCYTFDVKEQGNVKPSSDPHKELTKKNVLIQRFEDEDICETFKLTEDQFAEKITKAKKILFDARAKRPRPHLDDKIITAWNGLMISALARASQVLSPKYLEDAVKCATFIKENMYKDGILMRSHRGEVSNIQGFLSDYSFLIRGLLDLYQAGGDIAWLQWAEELQTTQDKIFFDSENCGYFESSGQDPSILIRMRETYDGAEPSGNSVAIMNLLRLGHILNSSKYTDIAKKSIESISTMFSKAPHAIPEAMCALDEDMNGGKLFTFLFDHKDESLEKFLHAIHSKFIPSKDIIYWNKKDAKSDEYWNSHLDYLQGAKLIDGKTTLYLCENFSCQMPTNSSEDFVKQLK